MKIPISLKLGPLDRSHGETIRAWRNDYAIWRWCRQNDLISDMSQEDWLNGLRGDPARRMYVVLLGSDPVGVCGFTSIDWIARRAEFSLYIAPLMHRHGLGKDSLRLLLAHGFQNLGLNQIWGESLFRNPAVKIFEDLGFKKDGIRRDFYWKDGAFHDAHLYSILRKEWLIATSASISSSRSSPSQPSAMSLSPISRLGEDEKSPPRRRRGPRPSRQETSTQAPQEAVPKDSRELQS